jgi:hypothetical protein
VGAFRRAVWRSFCWQSPIGLERNYNMNGAVYINNVHRPRLNPRSTAPSTANSNSYQGHIRRTKDSDHRGERCRLAAITKFEPPAHKAYFMCLTIYPIVEPSRVRARMREKYNECSAP